MPELVVLLDENNQPIGTAEKLSVHHANTPRHLAFSCYIFNDKGQFLITQRAKTKKVWPGYWTNSVCGHPAPEESFDDAIKRRAQFELGMQVTDISEALSEYSYTTPPDNGVIENEFCPVFFAHAASGVAPNPDEVGAFEWLNWDDYLRDVKENPDKYSYWCKDQLKQLKDLPIVVEYSRH